MKDLKALVLKELSTKTQHELAREIGVSQGTISNITSGIIPRKLDALEKLATYFRISIDEIRAGRAETVGESTPFYQMSERYGRDVPVINQAACGKWRDFTDLDYPSGHAERFEPAPTKNPKAFYVIASGDSMIGGDIREGDLLLVEPGLSVRDGQIVLARTDKGCTVKKFFRQDDHHVELRPMNEAHRSLMVKDDPSLRVYRITRIVKAV